MPSTTPAHARNVIPLLFAALAIIAALVLLIGWRTQRTEEKLHWDEHTYQVLYELEATLVHTLSIQSGARGFALTGQPQFLTPYESGLLKVQLSVAHLRALVQDNPAQEASVGQLSRLIDEEISVMQQRLEARRSGGLMAAANATADGRGKKIMDQIRGLIASMEQTERRLLASRANAAEAAGWWTLLIVCGAAALSAVILLTAIRAVRRVISMAGSPSAQVA